MSASVCICVLDAIVVVREMYFQAQFIELLSQAGIKGDKEVVITLKIMAVVDTIKASQLLLYLCISFFYLQRHARTYDRG